MGSPSQSPPPSPPQSISVTTITTTMSQIKLTYFDLRARAEPARLVLAYAGVRYTEKDPCTLGQPCTMGCYEANHSLWSDSSAVLGWGGYCSVHGYHKVLGSSVWTEGQE